LQGKIDFNQSVINRISDVMVSDINLACPLICVSVINEKHCPNIIDVNACRCLLEPRILRNNLVSQTACAVSTYSASAADKLPIFWLFDFFKLATLLKNAYPVTIFL
jgi:hypothetical protein